MIDICACCGQVMSEDGSHFCTNCAASVFGDNKDVYIKRNCPECGGELEVYYDGPRSGAPEPILIRHCKKCLRDWESDWYGNAGESELRRKFWG